ncbi:flagellar hook assembly protein FlgD [Peristeroidobacter soli]|jgi:flagellar basal-body rod modification protein FlgD|uniref:flagellar hook assembly protein FlgD n=1 Tax=Peristeroidobacter soli TaxID=2497877 RepID=UPI00101C099B|nr:flagellar hook capping FlgD N-terminal domain-containing protein [Peristeroidobacter soli]
MAIATDPIQNWAAQAQAEAEAKQKKDQTLGIDSFLTLMTAQLKNQDPLKPLEGTEFISQLAQFGTVSGVQGMQTSLETLAASLRSTQTLNGSTMIGRDILASADSFEHTQGGTVSGQVDVPAGTTSLQLRITDSAGTVVREIQLETAEGTQNFTWDGLRSDGTQAESDTYDIEAVANVRGQSGSLEVLMAGRVSSVSLDASGNNLSLNTPTLGSISMADVRRVQ